MISGRGAAAARGRIRPPRRIVRANAPGEGADFEICWNMIKEALRDIHTKSCGLLSFEELYRAAYKIVLMKKGDVLYDKVKEFEEHWFAEHVIPKIAVLVTKNLINIGVDKTPAASVNERRLTGEKFLKGLRDTWEDHNMSMNMVADILMYLDRGYTQQEPQAVSIFATTIALFRDHILRSCLNSSSGHLVTDILISVMLDQIDMERQGDVIDRNLIRHCSRMLSCLNESEEGDSENATLYQALFETRFLSNSRVFYTAECERLLREADASTWLRHTEARLLEEAERGATTIELESLPKVMQVIDEQLILAHMGEFLAMEGSGLRWMIDNDKTADLSILYRLISRVDDKKTALRDGLQKRALELGLEIENVPKTTGDFNSTAGAAAADGEDGGEGEKTKTPPNAAAQQTAAAIKWVDDVLKLKDKFDALVSTCFQGDIILQTALAKSFTDFINDFKGSPEYVSLFIDDGLKRGIRGKTEAEVDAMIDKAIVLVLYLQDRDKFHTHYLRHLARRLLHGKSESHDVEKQMISRMKQDLGQQFTVKFEGMFRDLVTSAELTTTYRDHMRQVGGGGEGEDGDGDDGDGDGSGFPRIDLNVSVLTTNNWPAEIMGRTAQIGERDREGSREGSRIIGCTYPHEVARLQASFEQFYLTNKNGRKLTWIGGAGTADVRCTFPPVEGKSTGPLARERRYELTVSTFGMVVLRLFNDVRAGESLSFEEIQAKTGIGAADLSRTLMAIAVAPKSRMLLKEPATKAVKPGDSFSFNEGFYSKAIRIKAPVVNAVSRVEDREERKTTEEKNNQTRAHIVDAAIVRIMKARKELSHSQLVSELLSQLAGRFKPDVSLIKKRIEDLIVREYLERPDEEGAPSMYRYMA